MAAKGKITRASGERIRTRAYESWLREGCPEGQDIAHWQQAEAELMRRPRRSRRQPLAAE